MDARQQTLPGTAVPGEGEELVPRRIAVPGRHRLALRPLPVAQLRPFQTLQHAPAERLQLHIHRFDRPPPEVHRDVDAPALELAFMEETQTWHEKRRHRRGAMLLRREDAGGTRFVVIFEKANRLALILR